MSAGANKTWASAVPTRARDHSTWVRDPFSNVSAGGPYVQYFTPLTALGGPYTDAGNGNLGNAGYNSLRGPAGFYSDLSVTKDFPIFERVKMQFRMDAFNIFNHPVYAFSGNNGANSCIDCQNTNVSSNNGRITDIEAGTTMRELQFALRLTF